MRKTELDPSTPSARVRLRRDLLDDLTHALFETPYDVELLVAVRNALTAYRRRRQERKAQI